MIVYHINLTCFIYLIYTELSLSNETWQIMLDLKICKNAKYIYYDLFSFILKFPDLEVRWSPVAPIITIKPPRTPAGMIGRAKMYNCVRVIY